MADNKGRRKGSRNKGHFYRTGRGWYAKDRAGRFVPLANEAGERLKDAKTPEDVLKPAYARFLLASGGKQASGSGVTLAEVCEAYLSSAKREGAAESTLDSRAGTLFDFCTGLPNMWREKPGQKPFRDKPKRQPTAADKLHPGYGTMPAASLKPFHIEAWLKAHTDWSPSGSRSRIQAVKRALNKAVELRLIETNPIRGMKVPKGRARVTYLTPEQEAALLKAAGPALRLALRVLIRTGMRPGCELGKLTARHIVDHGDKLELRFKAEESKTRRLRVVRVTDAEIMAAIRQQVAKYPSGPIFRNAKGGPWVTRPMSHSFRRALARAEKAGAQFDDDVCLYSTRHTYAKKMLTGAWTGKCIGIDLLAKLMGNTPQVCRENYLNWTAEFEEVLWSVC